MVVSFVRIDDRMIHGQTVTRWAKEKPCDGLIAVNDAAASNKVLIQAYKGASDKKTFVWTKEAFKEKSAKVTESETRYFLITKNPIDMKDGLRINYIHHNKQVVEKPALSGEGVAFFSGEEKPAGDYEQELFYHIVADGAEQVVKPAQAAVVTRVLEAIYESAKSGKTIYFD